MPVVKTTVEHGTDGSGVAQQFSPVLDGAIRGQDCAGPFVAPHDDFQQFLGCSQWQFAHAQIVDDQQARFPGTPFALSACRPVSLPQVRRAVCVFRDRERDGPVE